jgi:chromosome segregation ATPase
MRREAVGSNSLFLRCNSSSRKKSFSSLKDLMADLEEKKEREAALTEAREALSSMDSKASRVEEDAQVTREASEKAKEETARLREHVILAEEAASNAREEAEHYKGAATELDKEKRLVESDLIAIRDAYHGIKEEHLKSEISRGATEEAREKAREDLEAERIRFRGLSDDVDRLKKMLQEKEEAIFRSGKMIEDLRVTWRWCPTASSPTSPRPTLRTRRGSMP